MNTKTPEKTGTVLSLADQVACEVREDIIGLLRSPLLDAFFTNIAAQMRRVFAVAPDEENFQRPGLERDRQIHDLLADGQP